MLALLAGLVQSYITGDKTWHRLTQLGALGVENYYCKQGQT